jgi:hypothetical protein
MREAEDEAEEMIDYETALKRFMFIAVGVAAVSMASAGVNR